MDLGFNSWMALESAMQGDQPRRTPSRATLRRVLAFARPHRRDLLGFLALSVVGATLTVATPVLAGRVVDAIIKGGDEGRIIGLAALIAVLAVVDAAGGVAGRWLSSRIGEGLILDLRRAVFGHVQKMPVAFFTRTRTGALVSRLNNDVIGAQRAFTWTLSGVVGNLIALLLTLGVMLRLSWPITVLALVLLPVFVLPARRMGSRLASMERESADHNAAMTTQMTERFSAPGATLVKLFGRPDHEVGERGYRLSGGERQRLTIARLLVARPRVVILDEATAHLDSTSEAAVQAALATALAGRTALVIAHRLSTIRDADAIVVIEDGRVLEQGTHTDLLARGGRYAELYRTQFEDDPPVPLRVRSAPQVQPA